MAGRCRGGERRGCRRWGHGGRLDAQPACGHRRSLCRRGFRDARRRPQLPGDHPRRCAAGGARGRAHRCAVDRRVRPRLLSSHGRLPLSADAAVRRVGYAGPDDLLRPARPRPLGQSSAGDLYPDATGQGSGDRAAGDFAARPDRAGRPFDGRDDGVVARPAVPASLRQPDRRSGTDLVCGRRGGRVAAGRDPE